MPPKFRGQAEQMKPRACPAANSRCKTAALVAPIQRRASLRNVNTYAKLNSLFLLLTIRASLLKFGSFYNAATLQSVHLITLTGRWRAF